MKTVGQFLACDPRSAASQLKARHITEDVIAEWKAQADLVRRAPDLAGHDAQILTAVGVRDVATLASMNPKALLKLVRPFAESPEGKRLLRSSAGPDLAEVKRWIASAKTALATAA